MSATSPVPPVVSSTVPGTACEFLWVALHSLLADVALHSGQGGISERCVLHKLRYEAQALGLPVLASLSTMRNSSSVCLISCMSLANCALWASGMFQCEFMCSFTKKCKCTIASNHRRACILCIDDSGHECSQNLNWVFDFF